MSGFWHDERVRQRAYEIWELAGRPDDKATEHWLQAEAEIQVEEQGRDEEARLEAEGAV